MMLVLSLPTRWMTDKTRFWKTDIPRLTAHFLFYLFLMTIGQKAHLTRTRTLSIVCAVFSLKPNWCRQWRDYPEICIVSFMWLTLRSRRYVYPDIVVTSTQFGHSSSRASPLTRPELIRTPLKLIHVYNGPAVCFVCVSATATVCFFVVGNVNRTWSSHSK